MRRIGTWAFAAALGLWSRTISDVCSLVRMRGHMPPQFDVLIYAASIWVIPLIIAITFHEAAHGYVAHFFGDDTAWQLGRVTLNPFKHIDPVGTILLPALLFVTRSPILFGYAKPVPVNFRALRNPRRDMIWVAAAGPGMNIGLAVLAALSFHVVSYSQIRLDVG
jgi:Zn-dependent protease